MTQKLKALTNHFKGSILAYTLIVLTIMLMTALSVASVTILDKKNAATTAGSTQAFNNADSGSEILLGYRYRDDQQSLNTLATSRENGSCTNGVVTFDLSGGTVTLTTYSDTEGNNPITACGTSLATVQKVKSVGSYSGSSRAIEVAVAASGDYQTSCFTYGDPFSVSCCRLAIKTGAVTCAISPNYTVSAWQNSFPQPSFPTVAGDYQLSCFTYADPGSVSCCRLAIKTGAVTCAISPNYTVSAWQNSFPQPSF